MFTSTTILSTSDQSLAFSEPTSQHLPLSHLYRSTLDSSQGPKQIVNPRAHAHLLYDTYVHCEPRRNRNTLLATRDLSQLALFREEFEPRAPGPTTVLFQPHAAQSPIRQWPFIFGLRTSICTSPIPSSLHTASSATNRSQPTMWASTECESPVGIVISA